MTSSAKITAQVSTLKIDAALEGHYLIISLKKKKKKTNKKKTNKQKKQTPH